jgi:hypothetical protein
MKLSSVMYNSPFSSFCAWRKKVERAWSDSSGASVLPTSVSLTVSLTLAIVSPNRTVGPKGKSDRKQPKSENPPHNKLGEGGEKGKGRSKVENGDRVESKRNDEPAADYFAIIIEREGERGTPWPEQIALEVLTFFSTF